MIRKDLLLELQVGVGDFELQRAPERQGSSKSEMRSREGDSYKMEGHCGKDGYSGGLCGELCSLQMSFGKPRGRLDTGHDLNEDQFFTTTLTISKIIFILQRRICCQNRNLFTTVLLHKTSFEGIYCIKLVVIKLNYTILKVQRQPNYTKAKVNNITSLIARFKYEAEGQQHPASYFFSIYLVT